MDDVQRVHMFVRNVNRKVRGYLSHIVTPSRPWSIKRGRGPLLKGLPILGLKGILPFFFLRLFH